MPEEFGAAEKPNSDRDVQIRRPPYPILVTLAGIAWIGFGCLMFLTVVVLVVLAAATMPEGPDKAAAMVGLVSCGVCLPMLFGLAFTFVGAQSVRGTARDTLGNGIGSIVIGLLIVPVVTPLGVAQRSAAGQPGSAPPAVQAVQAMSTIIIGACGVGLVVAGILALVGRTDYRAWRQSQQPVREWDRNRGSRRRRDEDDDRDRPKRRDEDDDKFRA